MKTFTSTLPDDLFLLLDDKAKQLRLPKNRLIENALRLYLTQLEKAEYMQSYSGSGSDENILKVAEEGMQDYYKQLKDK